MNARIGWVRPGAAAIGLTEFDLVPDGPLNRVSAPIDPSDRDARLRAMQGCYRAFEAFLPDVFGNSTPEPEVRLELLERIAGLGQLRASARRTVRDVEPVKTGRAFLSMRAVERAARTQWHNDAERLLSRLTMGLSPLARRFEAHGDRVFLDLLVPSALQAEVSSRFGAKQRLDPADPEIEVAICGLWIPLSFVSLGGDAIG